MSLLFGTGAIAGSVARGAPGMVLIKPTSIAHSGTSASIGANGQVTFTAVTSLSLNGVFSADFDNYVVYASGTTPNNRLIQLRLRASGSDASGSDYVFQGLGAYSTTIEAFRSTVNITRVGSFSSANFSGVNIDFYGPNLTQPTALRTGNIFGVNGAELYYYAVTHSLSTAYDGFTLIPSNSDSMTGKLAVYGVRS